MSLAMYAAPFNNENNEDNNNNFVNETPINKKRNLHNKTQKRNDYNSQKVNAVLESIHNSSQEENDLGDFQPMSPPTSMGVENTKIREGMTNNSPIQANETDNVDLKTLQNNFLNDKAVEKYYQNLIPTYSHNNNMNTTMNNHPNNNHHNYITTESNKPYYPINYNSHSNTHSNSNIEKENENYNRLVEKLNYMINLLEEQQDERTNNVTEEVVLYSFLGIFIIFIVDSFARVGKYVR
jgi:hypothetical protein